MLKLVYVWGPRAFELMREVLAGWHGSLIHQGGVAFDLAKNVAHVAGYNANDKTWLETNDFSFVVYSDEAPDEFPLHTDEVFRVASDEEYEKGSDFLKSL